MLSGRAKPSSADFDWEEELLARGFGKGSAEDAGEGGKLLGVKVLIDG